MKINNNEHTQTIENKSLGIESEYKIIISHNASNLSEQVAKHILEGWKPVGSHQVVIRHQQNRFRGQQHMDTLNDLEYSQTLVK